MLDRRWIRENPELLRKAIGDKKEKADLDRWLDLDQQCREIIVRVEQNKARRNASSESIADMKKSGEDASAAIAEMKDLSAAIKEDDRLVSELQEKLTEEESGFPNLPDEDVPRGGEEANEIVREWGELPTFDWQVLPHWELGEKLGILHLEAASRMSGSGFSTLTGALARLERALINWFLDVHVQEQGYVEMNPPFLVRDPAVFGTGQLPKLGDDMYHVPGDGLWLIPTAEVSVTNFLREEILEAERIPCRFVAYSPCFRREAGSAGKDTRGILRVHQFNKVEMVRFTAPERSEQELEELVNDAAVLLERLNLPYRVVKLASGDLSFAAAKCYDLEAYSPGVDAWLEVSSCSNFRDFQARRAKIRYRPEKGAKATFVHTINGSGLALPRVLIAILENYQDCDGRVHVPPVLQPYMNGLEIIG